MQSARTTAWALGIMVACAGAAMGQTNESRKLVASDAAAGDAYGYAIAVSGELTVIGAMFDDNDLGSVYVVDAATGQELYKLTASDGVAGDLFGISVALDGTTAVVGSIWNNGNGAAYVFDVTTGQELFKLTANDGTVDDRLGVSVAIDGDRILVGASYDDWAGDWSGSVYIFDRATGVQTAKLTATDTQPYDQFGFAIAVSGDRALIGAYGDSAAGDVSGMAYVFDLTTNTELYQFQPSDVEAYDYFAKALDLEGDIAVLGSENDDDDDVNSGSAYIYNIATQQWLAKLTPSQPTMLGFFGAAIDISGDQVLIGQWFGVNPGEAQGLAYLFDIPTTTELAVLGASDGEDYDLFGFAVGLTETAAVVGAYGNDPDGLFDAGAAYVFDLAASCATDLNDDGEVNTQDFLLFLNAWSAGEPLADWNDDGVVNTQDFLAYLNDWVAGC
ncbi:hypothetical protein MNBD_PLANCTO03-1614 [hydrothermal vent metagenome]|uniref:Uncharacterized protein n=1 Tax=hydrothermal vent metagenome TaxID=652676 RepID=A0A3B1DNU6_9ZZZZ